MQRLVVDWLQDYGLVQTNLQPLVLHISRGYLKCAKQGFSMCVLKILKSGSKTCCFTQIRDVIDICKTRVLNLHTDSCDLCVGNRSL